MKSFIAAAAFAGAAVAQTLYASPTSVVSAQGAAPTGCSYSYNGIFQIQAVNATSPAGAKVKRQAGELIAGLSQGILSSSNGAVAYIAGGNHQFQFSDPGDKGQPQPGFIYDAGFSVCGNGTIAHGNSAIWYECTGGARNIIADVNIYGSDICYEIFLQVVPYGAGAPTATVTAMPISTITDGQPQAPKPTGGLLTFISDNQPQAPKPTGGVLTFISDNQPQAPTPVSKPYGTTTSKPVQYTGAANVVGGSLAGAVAAGLAAVAML